MNIGSIQFRCPDEALNAGFDWAKQQALYYVHPKSGERQDLVGPWYEAALPGRDAFCIRDVCHQANGAHALGLEQYTKNMLLRFVQSIAASRDYCCFWEIDKHYRPAPVDYTSDTDFWYNLPANFDLLACCLRMYRLTGDRDYIESEDFLHFYELTMKQYIETWDKNGDGIPEGSGTRRGIPSYEESEGGGSAQMLDLLAAQSAAMFAYAEIRGLNGADGAYYREWGEKILSEIDRWWDGEQGRYHFTKRKDGSLGDISHIAVECVPYFHATHDPEKLSITLDKLHQRGLANAINVEVGSHLAEIFYRHNQPERGEHWLRHYTSPKLKRREYPEVSFACVGAFVFGMMGITYDCESKTVTANPNLPEGMTSASLTGLPVFGRTADVLMENGEVTITYRG
ncbi:MAG: hypothetical protein IJX93_02240 [Clostridia bacterium]|nr:hypothetical protein [Clostridia bacterium]